MRLRIALVVLAIGAFMLPTTPALAANLHAAHRGTTVECDGQVLWHFVHNQVGRSNSTRGTLTAIFDDSGSVIVLANKVLRSVRHYDVLTDAGDTLINASDTIGEGKLVLSHTECLGGEEPPPELRCPLNSTVSVTWPGVELGRPNVAGLQETATASASLLPGRYEVTLTSTDVNHTAGFQTNQDQEQWFVRLVASGTTVAATGAIADLPTADTMLTQLVGTIELPGGADTAVATHLLAGQPANTWGSPESVEPTSAVFRCVG